MVELTHFLFTTTDELASNLPELFSPDRQIYGKRMISMHFGAVNGAKYLALENRTASDKYAKTTDISVAMSVQIHKTVAT